MQTNLQEALRMLRAIRERHEAGCDVGLRSYTVQVVLGNADTLWITAAIEALKKVTEPPRTPS